MADTQSRPSRAPIDALRDAVFVPMAVRAALQLDVFTPLADGPMTAEELAAALDVRPRRLELLLYQLAAANFLELQDDRFANTALSAHYLVKGSPTYVGGVHAVWTETFRSLMAAAESIRTDTPQSKIDFSGMSSDELGNFLKGLHGGTVATGRNLAKQPQFADAGTVVDLGGGSGGLAIGLCQEHPHLKATVIDLPAVTPIAEEMVEESGMSDRIDVETRDVLGAPLDGEFDAAMCRAFFQVLSAENCALAAKHIGAGVASGGSLFVLGLMTDDSRLAPAAAVGMNVAFTSTYDDGQAYAESDYRGWLADAGFTNIDRAPFLGGYDLISATKA